MYLAFVESHLSSVYWESSRFASQISLFFAQTSFETKTFTNTSEFHPRLTMLSLMWARLSALIKLTHRVLPLTACAFVKTRSEEPVWHITPTALWTCGSMSSSRSFVVRAKFLFNSYFVVSDCAIDSSCSVSLCLSFSWCTRSWTW